MKTSGWFRSWGLVVLAFLVLAASGCSGYSVGYNPVSACGSPDYDADLCNK